MKSLAPFRLAHLLIVLALAAGLVGAAPAAAQVDEPIFAVPVVASASQARGWARGFQMPGLNGAVHALAVGPDGAVYAGGDFTSADGTEITRVARWDGTTWHPLGSGIDGTVYALAVDKLSNVYAGGSFTTAGGMTANHIARWDGSAWHPLGDGMGGDTYPYVFALALGLNGSLYAGGAFTTAGGMAANYIARWDGSAWHPLSDGVGGEYPPVFALATGTDGSLYVGGWFTTAGDVEANYIARWDGAAWHALGGGMTRREFTYSTPVDALAVDSDGSLYAGGVFQAAGGMAAGNIAKWDGTTWSALDTGVSGCGGWGCIHALVVGPGSSLYAAGTFSTAGGITVNSVARWDGAAWHALGAGLRGGFLNDDANALAMGTDGSLYAGGYFLVAGDIAAKSIARWEPSASSWHLLGSGNGISGVPVRALAASSDGSLYAGGYFSSAGSAATNSIARWDGTTWHSLGSGMADCGQYFCVDSLAVGPGGMLYAGGKFKLAGGVPASNIALWDGAAWHDLGGGTDDGVQALTVGPDGSLYAGGDFTVAGGVAANHIARWDGKTWLPLGDGLGREVSALAVDKLGNVYAAFSSFIARWDGAAWDFPGWMNYPVFALMLGPDGSLYAGGNFTSAGGVAADNIARWDGAAWHPLGSGVSGQVFDLAFGSDGSLYAGGAFTTAGGVAANHIARWDGSWHRVGAGLDSDVMAVAVGPDGLLYAGGYFAAAGQVLSSRIALWLGEYRTQLPLVLRR